jgi:ribosomal-protein-alanine N-acetyltransferase
VVSHSSARIPAARIEQETVPVPESTLLRWSGARYRGGMQDINVGAALEYEGVELIHPCLKAAGDMFAYGSDPEFCRYLTAKPFKDVSEAQTFIRSMIEANERGERLYFMIRVDGKVVGTIGLIFTWGRDSSTIEIGYGVARLYWGRGVFARALAMIIGLAVTMGKTKLVAMTRADNERSGRAVARHGFKPEPSDRPGVVAYTLRIPSS